MMSIEIHITKKVKKDLNNLASKRDQSKSVSMLKKLRTNPYLGKSLKGELKGYYSLHFSLSNGAARAIYKIIEDEKIVLVILVGYRENIYDILKRRIN